MGKYEQLTAIGMDVEALCKRLMGNEALIPLFIRKFLEDHTFEKLQEAFAAKDMQAAEMTSHTLKGMCGNLSLTELYALFTEQVNRIRSGNDAKAEAMMPQITVLYQKTMDGMNAFLTQATEV